MKKTILLIALISTMTAANAIPMPGRPSAPSGQVTPKWMKTLAQWTRDFDAWLNS